MVWRTFKKQQEEVEPIDIRDRGSREDKPVWEKIHEIADDVSPILGGIVISAANKTKEEAKLNKMIEGFNEINLSKVQNEINWLTYENELRKIEDEIRQTIVRSGKELKIHLPPDLRDFEFEKNEEIVNFAKARTTEVVNQMTRSSRDSFNFVLRDINNEDIGSSRKARLLLPLIGLTLRQARAVNNYRRNLIEEQEVKFDRAETLSQQRAENSLIYRGERMANNESMNAANKGFDSLVNAGIAAGVINARRSKKRWITVPDDRLCPYCAPMEGVEVGIKENFSTPLGIVSEPPIHLNCRCVAEFVRS